MEIGYGITFHLSLIYWTGRVKSINLMDVIISPGRAVAILAARKKAECYR
jgi:hypothetical protein